MRMDMAANLRDELLEIASTTLNDAQRVARYRRIAWEAIERLENRITISAPPVCVDAVKWEQKPLDCQGILYGGPGKIDVVDCDIPIPSGPIDIREFTCRRV
jgi:hypothetical protein